MFTSVGQGWNERRCHGGKSARARRSSQERQTWASLDGVGKPEAAKPKATQAANDVPIESSRAIPAGASASTWTIYQACVPFANAGSAGFAKLRPGRELPYFTRQFPDDIARHTGHQLSVLGWWERYQAAASKADVLASNSRG